jgi:hypothetical protein
MFPQFLICVGLHMGENGRFRAKETHVATTAVSAVTVVDFTSVIWWLKREQ